MYYIRQIKPTRHNLREFINFAFTYYKTDPNWVPSLKGDLMKSLRGINNPLFSVGQQAFFMLYDEAEKPVGRVLCGVDEKMNKTYNRKHGYFALFECINDQVAANMLFDAVALWQKAQGMEAMIGPVSPTSGDDSKGVLIDDFDGPPVLMNSYNPPFYEKLYETYGFEKDEDHVAYIIYRDQLDVDRMLKVVDWAQKRYNFRVERLDLSKQEQECRDIHRVLIDGIPDDWDYTTPPTLQSVTEEFDALKFIYKGRYCFIARSGDRPIGFIVALPDMNQVLKYIKRGRLFPTGFIRYYKHRSKVTGLRVFVQFVARDWQKKGVNNAMFAAIFKDFEQKSTLQFVEGSTIGEKNIESRLSVEKVGMQLYRTYRVYQYSLRQ